MGKNFPKSKKARRERMVNILDTLAKEYPDAQISLEYETPFQLLVATILSAQCTDERVNQVTELLFDKYKSIIDFADAQREELEQDIYSTGFYKAKAKHIQESARKIFDDFGGEMPDNMDDMLELPGVGRKTANVVLGHAFGIPGFVVDTHVTRLANRLGFVDTKKAEKIERELMEYIPEDRWVISTHYFIDHGRAVCKARKAECGQCAISELCPSAFDV
ncbi:MAG: endonuclease III [Candidatus Kapaibacterium sp.]